MSKVRFVIYANDPFGLNYYSPQYNLADTADKTYEGNALLTQESLKDAISTTTTMLVQSPFTDIIMGFFGLANTVEGSPWYNYPTPVITWNGVPVTPMNTPPGWSTPNQAWGLAPNLSASLLQIVQSGKNLIASMQHDADLAYIQDKWNVADFYTAFSQQVLIPFNFTGLDLDMESEWSVYPQVLIDLSNTFGQNGYFVSHAPYGYLHCGSSYGSMLTYYLCTEQSQASTPIVGHTVIKNNAGQNVNSISWLNNQYYSGGDQGSAADTVQQYIVAANAAAAIPNSGISNPNYFCLAGFAPVICDPQYVLWNQYLTQEAEKVCQNGSIQCDPCNNRASNVYVMDAVNGLVSHFGKDASGQAQFGGVFIYSYRYYNATQVGYSYQVSMWNTIAAALGLVQ